MMMMMMTKTRLTSLYIARLRTKSNMSLFKRCYTGEYCVKIKQNKKGLEFDSRPWSFLLLC